MVNQRNGLYLVIGAYTTWGLLTLYWPFLAEVPALITLTHRVLGALLIASLILYRKRALKDALSIFRERKSVLVTVSSALSLALNWLVFVWAMGHNQISETGLGYFICPLLSVVLGAAIFGERLSLQQALGIFTVFVAVALKATALAEVPYVAILLAFTFATYGSLKKHQSRPALQTLFTELLIVAPIVLLLSLYSDPEALFRSYGMRSNLLLALSGVITLTPMIMLVKGLAQMSLQSSAICQFISPTLTVLLASCFGESIRSSDAICFLLIWLGILIYCLGSSLCQRSSPVRVRILRD